MVRSSTNELRSVGVLSAKYYFEIFLPVVSGLVSNWWRDWGLLLSLPLAVAGFFQLSLATVEVRDGVLRYRRFVKWTIIPPADVVSCAVLMEPITGYIKLRRSVPPWGRLYFVLDRPHPYDIFRKPEHPLLRYIAGEPTPAPRSPESRAASTRALPFKLAAAASAGALIVLIPAMLGGHPGVIQGRSVLDQPLQDIQSPWMRLPIQGALFFARPPVAASLCAIFAFLAVRQRHRPDSSIYALLAGLALPYALAPWLF